jgi:hypothetical protein
VRVLNQVMAEAAGGRSERQERQVRLLMTILAKQILVIVMDIRVTHTQEMLVMRLHRQPLKHTAERID